TDLRRKASGPTQNCRDADTPLEQLGFPTHERPSSREALTAVVASEHNNGVFKKAFVLEALDHATDSLIQGLDDFSVRLKTAAVIVRQAGKLRRYLFITGCFPWPVRRSEVQGQHEWIVYV